tara:strand:- start:11875 stop:12042 length:168 start_codon:yes stop_codon:yes gene_type:complete
MKRIALILFTVFLNIGLFSCTPDALVNGTTTSTQACCGDDDHTPPPPPPPPPNGD